MKKIAQNKKIVYTDEPIQMGAIVNDLLPSDAEFIFRETTKKVTIALTERSIDYFKKIAGRHDITLILAELHSEEKKPKSLLP